MIIFYLFTHYLQPSKQRICLFCSLIYLQSLEKDLTLSGCWVIFVEWINQCLSLPNFPWCLLCLLRYLDQLVDRQRVGCSRVGSLSFLAVNWLLGKCRNVWVIYLLFSIMLSTWGFQISQRIYWKTLSLLGAREAYNYVCNVIIYTAIKICIWMF